MPDSPNQGLNLVFTPPAMIRFAGLLPCACVSMTLSLARGSQAVEQSWQLDFTPSFYSTCCLRITHEVSTCGIQVNVVSTSSFASTSFTVTCVCCLIKANISCKTQVASLFQVKDDSLLSELSAIEIVNIPKSEFASLTVISVLKIQESSLRRIQLGVTRSPLEALHHLPYCKTKEG